MKRKKLTVSVAVMVAAFLMITACGTIGPVIDDPAPVPVTDPIDEIDIDVPDEELPDEMLESQPTCGKFDEDYVIFEGEAEEFFATYMYAFRSALSRDYLENGYEGVKADPWCIENIGCVYGLGEALVDLGEGDWTYTFNGYEIGLDAVIDSLIENDMIAPDECDTITDELIYQNGVTCVNAYAAQKVLDGFYGVGLVDTLGYDNYSETFSSEPGYIITGVGIGSGVEYTYEIKDIAINCNVATVSCDKYSSFMGADYEYKGECEVTLYKDDTGVHFYSIKDL